MLLFVFGESVAAQRTVTSPKEWLDAAVRDVVFQRSGTSYDDDVSWLTALDASGREIGGLTEIGHCSSLRNTDFRSHAIDALSALTELVALQCAYLDDNGIEDLSPLRSVRGLIALVPGGSAIADIAPLKGFVFLEQLNLSATDASDISILVDPLDLEHVDLRDTALHLGAGSAASAVIDRLRDRSAKIWT